jgi:deoxyribose-phosphate aldolase
LIPNFISSSNLTAVFLALKPAPYFDARPMPINHHPERFLDHTLLKADATEADIRKLCTEAREHSMMAVCVNPTWIPLCVELLRGSKTLPITVVGFPLGAMTSESKAWETENALKLGAQEIDMVLNLGFAKEGQWKKVENDIRSVTKIEPRKTVKVILETCYLNPDEIVSASKAAMEGGAAFVKTSTGFGPRGATIEDVRLMRKTVGPNFGVKASGGIREVALFKAMVEAGANRVGSSSSVKILEELRK